MAPRLLRYSIRMAVLTIGFAFVTYGAIAWHYQDFATQGVWLYDNGWMPHPMHFLVFGMCVIPLALWDIFVLEQGRAASRRAMPPAADDAVAPEIPST